MAGGSIPANLAPIFQQAGAQYKIPPAVLAGIASVESAFGRNRGPSSAGAVGLMQFEPGTARGIGINPYNDRQAIYGAAKLLNQYGYQQNALRALGAYNGGPGNPQYAYAHTVMSEAQRLGLGGGAPATGGGASIGQAPTQANASSAGDSAAAIAAGFLQNEDKINPWETPVKGSAAIGGDSTLLGMLQARANTAPSDHAAAQGSLQQLAGSNPLSVHPNVTIGKGGYVNPFAGWSIGRTDQGVDVNAPKAGTPLPAIGDSKVIGVIPNWYNGQPYVWLQLLNGPAKGRYYYYSEQISGVPRIGSIIRKGQPVVYYAPSGSGVEAGWATANGATLARATSGYSEGQQTPAGKSFRNFLGI